LSRSPSRRSPARPAASPAGRRAASSPAKSRSAGSPVKGRPAAVPPRQHRFPFALVAGVALAAGLTAVIVVTMGAGSDDRPLEVGTPTITGESLVRFTSADNDPAVGRLIPEVSGADFDGTPVTITRDGRAKMIMFMAHWCSVCQREVPVIVDWLPGAAIPDNVDLVMVNTGVDRRQANYPPSEWLEREGWTLPVLLDDAAHRVGAAFGLSAYPYFVFVNADGSVAGRLTGGLPAETLSVLVAGLAEA
jgi:thiol-disulfide isomerase/thioredoxin